MHDIEKAIEAVAIQLKEIGKGNASTPMGAIELHSKSVLDGSGKIADALLHIGDSIDRMAESLENWSQTK